MGKKSQSMGFDPEVVQMTKSIVKNIKLTMANALHVFKNGSKQGWAAERGGKLLQSQTKGKEDLTMSGMKTMH